MNDYRENMTENIMPENIMPENIMPENIMPENIMPEKEMKKKAPLEKCIPQETVIEDVKLAHAYVPFQKYCDTYMPIESLKRGTAFPELLMPYFEPQGKMKYKKY